MGRWCQCGPFHQDFFGARRRSGQSVCVRTQPFKFSSTCNCLYFLEKCRAVANRLGECERAVALSAKCRRPRDTSRIVDTDSEGVFVDIRSGTSVISEGIAKAPNAIKIDVEGFECEVLEGLDEHLKQSILRIIGIEVHFGLLKARGLSQAPKQIEELLIERGFNVKWTDASHIVAVRGT